MGKPSGGYLFHILVIFQQITFARNLIVPSVHRQVVPDNLVGRTLARCHCQIDTEQNLPTPDQRHVVIRSESRYQLSLLVDAALHMALNHSRPIR